jgi:nitrogen fixation-related uncharacterized protein
MNILTILMIVSVVLFFVILFYGIEKISEV